MRTLLKCKSLWITLALIAGVAGAGLGKRETLCAWYHVRQLANAYPNHRDDCIARVVALDEVALPRLRAGLHDADPLVCDNMQAALEALVKKWGADDARAQALVLSLGDEFDLCSQAGQEKTLFFLIAYLGQPGARPLPPTLAKCIGELMLTAERRDALRPLSLLLAGELIDCVPPGQWVDAARELAERGLTDTRPGARSAALQLLRRGPMARDKELLARAIPLLGDREASVRRRALLALAAELDLLREDALLPLLQDDDAEMQYLCELALRQRGLTDSDLELARLISHKDPAVRMRVLHLLPRTPDLNLGEWLRQLSQDPSPAVRAAAVRAAGENTTVDLSARLREMAASDPSEAVRLNAQFYVQQHSTHAVRK